MAAKTVLICSNGVNRGCGSIAVSVEQLLRRAGYRVVHASSGGSLALLRGMGREPYEIIGYYESYSKAKVNEAACVVDWVAKNVRYAVHDRFQIDRMLEKEDPAVCVSIYEGFAAYSCYYKGIPVVEFSDMLFFKLLLHECSDTQTDHASNYLTGLNIAMAPYTRGLAITLYPNEIRDCRIRVPPNCRVVGPLLADDVRALSPLPPSARRHVCVYVSGATEKCEWLYSVLATMPQHRFVVFDPDSTVCAAAGGGGGNVEIHPTSREAFVDALQHAYACITNSGLQTAAEAIHLQVYNYTLPTQNHHAQGAVSEAVQRAGAGETCLRETSSKTKACPDFAPRLRAFLDRARDADVWDVAPVPDGGSALLEAVRACEAEGHGPTRSMVPRYACLLLGALVVGGAVTALARRVLLQST